MVQIRELKKSFWDKNIFDEAELLLGKRETWGLVWVNGSGKTTLFKILSWEDKEFEWSIIYDTKYPLIGYMKQEMSIENIDSSILDFLKSYTGIDKIEEHINELIHDLEDPQKLEKYWEIYEIFEKIWWYEFDYRAQKVLNQIGLSKYSLVSNINQLSGWEKRKLLLCGTLLKWGDLLLLDEPTNDLDASSVQGLVTFLKDSLSSCLIVSHDKNFLNSVVKKIFEIRDNQIIQYSWDYAFYEEQKAQEYAQNLDAYERQIEEEVRIKKATQELKQKAQNIGNKGNTRDNDKGDWSSKVEKKLAKSAKNMQNRIERMEKIEKPKVKRPIQITFSPSEEPTWWMDISDISFTYQGNKDFRLHLASLSIWAHDKLLIHWWNGEWKSTFLKLLIGELQQDTGSITRAKSLQIWYFAQEQASLPSDISPIDFLHEQLEHGLTDVHSVLWAMWFDDADKKKNIWLLSPGMRLRLTFALIILRKDNCLIFDEPTNHIDVDIKEALKKALNEFKWIVIVVSHDDQFINKINFTKTVSFKNWVGIEE